MSSPFYVSPEQWYTEKAEYARKGIARGKPIVAFEFSGGIMLMAENHSATLRKLSEIYDRIGFGGVGKLDEYENLRKAGIRYADMRGFSYSRDDVSGKSLATEYSNVLGNVFTREMKPFEVEILVCEIHGDGTSAFYTVKYDGSMVDRTHFAAIGGDGDKLFNMLADGWREGLSLADAALMGRKVLAEAGDGSGHDGLNAATLEIAILDRARDGRKFRRLPPEEIQQLLGG